jgi:hypothetical protein
VFQLASLTDVHWTMSGEVVLMTLLGGMGTVFGPMIGALVVVTMQNYLAQMGDWVTVIQGGIFVVSVMMFRQGIIGGCYEDGLERAGATAGTSKRKGDVNATSSQQHLDTEAGDGGHGAGFRPRDGRPGGTTRRHRRDG